MFLVYLSCGRLITSIGDDRYQTNKVMLIALVPKGFIQLVLKYTGLITWDLLIKTCFFNKFYWTVRLQGSLFIRKRKSKQRQKHYRDLLDRCYILESSFSSLRQMKFKNECTNVKWKLYSNAEYPRLNYIWVPRTPITSPPLPFCKI